MKKKVVLAASVLLLTQHISAQGAEPKLVDGYYVSKTPEGIAYISKPDDAVVGRWFVSCKVDEMTDKRNCLVLGYGEGSIAVIYGDLPKAQSVCVQGHNFPKLLAMVRIDKNPAVETDEKGCVPADKLPIFTSNTVRTRWFKWPNDVPIDTETSLAGLSVANKVVVEFLSGNLD